MFKIGNKINFSKNGSLCQPTNDQVTANDTDHDTAHDHQIIEIKYLKEKLILVIEGQMNRDKIMGKPEFKHRQHFHKN